MGAFVTGLEYSSGKTAEVVGKPAIPFFRAALDALGIAPEQAVLIGDDLADDIGGAQAAGIPGIMVRTGKYRTTDEDHLLIRPALTLDNFPAAVARLLGG
ncbi:MAG: HAD hydrolase-like protein [Propionivibrio sp.]|nr:HAD hydrolase-like protein [Propionivibrio sp.]